MTYSPRPAAGGMWNTMLQRSYFSSRIWLFKYWWSHVCLFLLDCLPEPGMALTSLPTLSGQLGLDLGWAFGGLRPVAAGCLNCPSEWSYEERSSGGGRKGIREKNKPTKHVRDMKMMIIGMVMSLTWLIDTVFMVGKTMLCTVKVSSD